MATKSRCCLHWQAADVYLTRDPIHIETLVGLVSDPDRGGIATFIGTVRRSHAGHEVVALSYTAYDEMAELECGAIIAEARRRWPVRVALLHRLGDLVVGDTAVVVAVAGAHRSEAFAACQWAIDEVKRRVPIWKRETYSDGTVAWVDPTASGGIVLAHPADSAAVDG